MGAFISLRFFDGLRTWERWATFLGGWALASWCSDGLAFFLGIVQPVFEKGISLGLGLFGMAIAAAIMKLIRETDWQGVIKSIVTFRFGGGDR